MDATSTMDKPNKQTECVSTTIPPQITLKQDTKKRKTWVWVPVVEETKNDEADTEINNFGRAKRNSMKKAVENISASLARKAPGSTLTTKKKRPKGGTIDSNYMDSKIIEKEENKREDQCGKVDRKANELDETNRPESSIYTADYKNSRESSIVVVDDMTEEEIVGNSMCSISPNINNNNPGSNSSNKTEPSDLPFSDMAITEVANMEILKSIDNEETENNSKALTVEKPKKVEVEKPELTIEVKERGEYTMEKANESIEEAESRELIKNDQEKEYQKQHQGIPIESWPPFPQYKKIEENIIRCKDAESKESKSLQCECNPTNKEKKRGQACADECLNRLLLMECGSECRSEKYCTNMRFQRREYADLEVFFTGPKGWGLRSKENIQIGQFLIEYVGEVINSTEMEKRIRRYGRDPNHKHHYLMALRSGTVIDATQNGNESRFINHSCDPNAVTQKWTVGRELRIGFFAIKPIQVGEEITFNYQFERYGKRAQKCFCETAACTGYIGSTKEMGSDAEELVSDSSGASNDEYSSDDNEQDDFPNSIQKMGSGSGNSGTKFIPFFSTERAEYLARKYGSVRKTGQSAGKNGSDERRGSLPTRKYKRRKGLTEEGSHHHRRVHLESISNPILREHSEVNEILLRGPLRNREQVLEFNRLMVRVDQQESRRRMVDFLLRIDDPNILRIFVANQGFALIRIWFVLPQFDRRSLQLQAQIARLLLRLPVTNKNQIDEVSIMSTLKQMITLELPDKFVVKDVVNKLVDSIALELDDSTINHKPEPPPIIREFKTFRDLASKLYEKWENLVDWEFRIPKKLVESKAEKKEYRSQSRHGRFRTRRYRGDDEISPDRTRTRSNSFERTFERPFDGPRGRYQRFQRHYRKFLPPHIRRKFHRKFPPSHAFRSPFFNDKRSFDENEEKTTSKSKSTNEEEEEEFETFFDPNEPPPSFFNLPMSTQAQTTSPGMIANPSEQQQHQQVPTTTAATFFPTPYQYYSPYFYPGAAYLHPPIYYHQDAAFAAMTTMNHGNGGPGGGYMPPPPPPPDKPSQKQQPQSVQGMSSYLDQSNVNIKNELNDGISTIEGHKNEEGNESSEQNSQKEIDVKKKPSDIKDNDDKPRERVKNKSSKDIQAEMLQRRLQSLRAALGSKASPSHWPPDKPKETSNSRSSIKSRSRSRDRNKSRSRSRDRNKKSKPDDHRDRKIKNRHEKRSRSEKKDRKEDGLDNKNNNVLEEGKIGLEKLPDRKNNNVSEEGKIGLEKRPDSKNSIVSEEGKIGLEKRPDSKNSIVSEEAKTGLESNVVIDLQKSGKKHLSENVKIKTPNGLPTALTANKIVSKVQPFKITRINPSNLPSADKQQDNIDPKGFKTGHFLPPPSMISSDEDEDDDEMMQPPEISVDILQDANKLDAYIHQLKEFVYFMETMRREMHGPLPFPGQLLLNHMRALKMPFSMKRSRQQNEDNQQQDEHITKSKRARIDPKDLIEQHKSNENQSSSHSTTPPDDPSVSSVKNDEPVNDNPHIPQQTGQVPVTIPPLPVPPPKLLATIATVSDPRLSKSMPSIGFESTQTSIPTDHSSKKTITTTKCEEQMTKIKEEVQMEISSNDNQQQTSMLTTNKWPMMTETPQLSGQLQQQKQEEGHQPITNEPTTSSASALTTSNVPLMSKSGLWIMHRDTDGTPYYYHKETRETRWELPEDEEPIMDISDPNNHALSLMETDCDERQKCRAEFKRQVSALSGKCIESYRKRFFRSSNDYINFIRKITHKVLENQQNNKELVFSDQVQKNTRRLVDDYIRHFKNKELAEMQKLAVNDGFVEK